MANAKSNNKSKDLIQKIKNVKSDGFLLCCAILKKEEKNSGFIAATLHFKGLSEDGGRTDFSKSLPGLSL
jgi:hypothetical protein